jgi:DNA-binding response OmpR family regulator
MTRIFVLEDDPDLLHLYTRALIFRGYEVDSANRADTAIGMIDNGMAAPDIAVLDMHMPGVSGSAVLEHLRSKSQYSEIPIIVISCDDDFRDRLYDREVTFLSKPISLADLYQAVELLAPEAA